MYDIKDTGKQTKFASGMVRDSAEGKWDPTLALDGPMFVRWYTHLSKAALSKYSKRNWMKANGEAELERFKISAIRHFLQWLNGETDEDHAAAVFFNINGVEYVRDKQSDSTPDRQGATSNSVHQAHEHNVNGSDAPNRPLCDRPIRRGLSGLSGLVGEAPGTSPKTGLTNAEARTKGWE